MLGLVVSFVAFLTTTGVQISKKEKFVKKNEQKMRLFQGDKTKILPLIFILKRIILVYFRSTTDFTSRSDVIKIGRAYYRLSRAVN